MTLVLIGYVLGILTLALAMAFGAFARAGTGEE
jgi:hypothetical protein